MEKKSFFLIFLSLFYFVICESDFEFKGPSKLQVDSFLQPTSFYPYPIRGRPFSPFHPYTKRPIYSNNRPLYHSYPTKGFFYGYGMEDFGNRPGMLENPLAFPFNYRSMDYPSSSSDDEVLPQISKESLQQALLMTEKYLEGNEADRQCLQREFCNFAVNMTRKRIAEAETGFTVELSDEQIAIFETTSILGAMVSEWDFEESEKYLPKVHQLMAALKVGSKVGENSPHEVGPPNLCQQLFPCYGPLIQRPPGLWPRIQGRTNCKATKRICPGLAIGCSLCAIFAPGKCAMICPITGMYCGTAGYACVAQKRPPRIVVVQAKDSHKEDVLTAPSIDETQNGPQSRTKQQIQPDLPQEGQRKPQQPEKETVDNSPEVPDKNELPEKQRENLNLETGQQTKISPQKSEVLPQKIDIESKIKEKEPQIAKKLPELQAQNEQQSQQIQKQEETILKNENADNLPQPKAQKEQQSQQIQKQEETILKNEDQQIISSTQPENENAENLKPSPARNEDRHQQQPPQKQEDSNLNYENQQKKGSSQPQTENVQQSKNETARKTKSEQQHQQQHALKTEKLFNVEESKGAQALTPQDANGNPEVAEKTNGNPVEEKETQPRYASRSQSKSFRDFNSYIDLLKLKPRFFDFDRYAMEKFY